MQRQASEIPWKVPLMSDEPITKVFKYFWEVADPTTGPSQEIASSLGKTVLLPLALSALGLMSLPSFPGQIMTPRQQVRQRVSPCQLVPWINQLPSTHRVNLNCLRQGRKLTLHCLPTSWMRGGHCHNSDENSKSPVYKKTT